jgi:hypothetical protein
MLYRLTSLFGYRLHATDGELGQVRDVYFDDHAWTVRYFVVRTGPWLVGQSVLISPLSAEGADDEEETLAVALTRQQVKDAPGAGTAPPVTRQHEQELVEYYGWAPYWQPVGAPAGGDLALPMKGSVHPDSVGPEERTQPSGDPCLRSVDEVTGYRIQATDGEIGHLEDFIADTTTWAIRYAVVDTGNWLPGRKVLLSRDWVARVDWSERLAVLDLSCDAIEAAPGFEPDAPLDREYEQRLHEHYGRSPYWNRNATDSASTDD